MFFSQQEYDVRCEWGEAGVTHLSDGSGAFIIVDVLSFSTSVEIATSNGAVVYPFRKYDESAAEYAASISALLASRTRSAGFTLSPASLLGIPAGTRLVLPSPNGSTLTLAARAAAVFAGCLRNARAVALAASEVSKRITVVPAGERWPNGTMRPAMEDLVGAGAIIHYLNGEKSSEAQAAEAAFLRFQDDLPGAIARCSSGKELIERGFPRDVELASELNASECAPRLVEGAYICPG